MALFDNLKSLMDMATDKAKDIAEVATEKAKAASDAAKLNMAILSEQRDLEKNYKAIGEWFVSEYEGEVPDAVKDVVAAVAASKAKIAELEAAKQKNAPEAPVEEAVEDAASAVKEAVQDAASTVKEAVEEAAPVVEAAVVEAASVVEETVEETVAKD